MQHNWIWAALRNGGAVDGELAGRPSRCHKCQVQILAFALDVE
jgi:hypothetical protein